VLALALCRNAIVEFSKLAFFLLLFFFSRVSDHSEAGQSTQSMMLTGEVYYFKKINQQDTGDRKLLQEKLDGFRTVRNLSLCFGFPFSF
jgi:hypothetical protein